MGSPLEGFSTEPVFILHGLWLGPGHPDTLARPLLPMSSKALCRPRGRYVWPSVAGTMGVEIRDIPVLAQAPYL